MPRSRSHLLLLTFVLSLSGILLLQSANPRLQAEPAITATVTPHISNYLPVVRGPGQAPTPTNTPIPGRLASPTLFDIINDDMDGNFTVSWSSAPDAEYYQLHQQHNGNVWQQVYEGSLREFARSGLSEGQYCYRVKALNAITDSDWSDTKCTEVMSATDTPEPTPSTGLEAPVIYDIENADGDGNYVVEWSVVEGAEQYRLREAINDVAPNDTLIYFGPNISFSRTNMPEGQHCYRVRGIIENGEWGPYSDPKCTQVEKWPEPNYECKFETLYNGPRTLRSDIEVLFDGRVFITGGLDAFGDSVDNLTIFDPTTRDFKRIENVPQDHAWNAAVLGDGQVMVANYYDNPHVDIYDPVSDNVSEFDNWVGCLETYRILKNGILMTDCGGEGAFYNPGSGYELISKFETPAVNNWGLHTFLIPRGPYATYSTNGRFGYLIEFSYPNTEISEIFDNSSLFNPPYESAAALSSDLNSIYFTGGRKYDDENFYYLKDATSVDLTDFYIKQLPEMHVGRIDHVTLGLLDNTIVVLGGESDVGYLQAVEIYDPQWDKWFEAGSLNIARSRHRAVILHNGDIFVYGGEAYPGLGYSYIAPPEIGRCERVTIE